MKCIISIILSLVMLAAAVNAGMPLPVVSVSLANQLGSAAPRGSAPAGAAQSLRPGRTKLHTEYGTAEVMSGRFEVSEGITKAEKARAFFAARQDAFKIARPAGELELVSEKTDELGLSHLRFQQVYNGLKVWGCQTIVHFEDDQTIYLVGGQIIPSPNVSTNPAISESDAAGNATASMDSKTAALQLLTESELLIYPNSGEPRLAYLVTVVSPRSASVLWRVFVDAQSGEILHKFNDVHDSAPVTGYGYNVLDEFVSFPINSSGGKYELVDMTRSGLIGTFIDMYNIEPDTLSTDPDGDTFWDDHDGQKAEVSAHHYTGLTYDYWLNNHARDSYDGSGSDVMLNLHDPDVINNAYWNGYWEIITFGDGDGVDYLPFSGSIDVVAHEFMHAVTQYNGNGGLIYEFQSGALNESYSDVFGAALDPWDWLLGEDIRLTPPYCIRSMENPNIRDHPDHMNDYRYLAVHEDNGGVHINSGIPNHAFYEAVMYHYDRSEIEDVLVSHPDHIFDTEFRVVFLGNNALASDY
ncbi:MAG: peptidase M4 family protein [Candidatus Zixiibacteriota bacterium]|nr:MAG: peptidase M4 family protein [candidate division Zixibacteria bacterium]